MVFIFINEENDGNLGCCFHFFIFGRFSQLLTTNCLPPHHKLPIYHPRFRLHVRNVRAGGEVADVNGNCTLTNKIFQNSRRLI